MVILTEMYQVLCLQVQVPKPQVQVQVPCFHCKYISSTQLPLYEKTDLLVIESLCSTLMLKK